MTEADTLEIRVRESADDLADLTAYISFTFGFLVTAFVAGDRLTTFQALAASGLYSVSAGSTALALVAYTQAWAAIKAESPTVLDSIPLFGGELWVGTTVRSISLAFLPKGVPPGNVRHRKIE